MNERDQLRKDVLKKAQWENSVWHSLLHALDFRPDIKATFRKRSTYIALGLMAFAVILPDLPKLTTLKGEETTTSIPTAEPPIYNPTPTTTPTFRPTITPRSIENIYIPTPQA
jgi:hypothetical protein